MSRFGGLGRKRGGDNLAMGQWRYTIFDMGYVGGTYGGNRLRCTSSGNSSLVLIVVCSLLGTAILSGVCGAAILFEPANLHS